MNIKPIKFANKQFIYINQRTITFFFFFFNNPAPTEFSPLPLPAALPISPPAAVVEVGAGGFGASRLHRLAAGAVLARQKALGQGEVGEHRQVPRLGDRQQRALEVALHEVVVRLQDRELRETELALKLQRGGEPLRRVVGSADVANRARLDELVEGAQRLLQRRLFVIEVRVIEIDAIRLQALQRSV